MNVKKFIMSASLGVAVREFLLSVGFAEYLFFVNEEPMGVIEAKKVRQTLIGVEERSAKYLTNLPDILSTEREHLAFSYETTGIETRFTNHTDPEPCSQSLCNYDQHVMIAGDTGNNISVPSIGAMLCNIALRLDALFCSHISVPSIGPMPLQSFSLLGR